MQGPDYHTTRIPAPVNISINVGPNDALNFSYSSLHDVSRMFVGLLATVVVARGAMSSIFEPVVVKQRMRDARDRHPPHLGVLQNPIFATSARKFLLGFAS